MADCGPIIGLKLDAKSQQAVEQIAHNQKVGKLVAAMLTIGVFNSIFTKSKAPAAGWNITQTDWELYTKALTSVPAVMKQLMHREIDMMLLHYQMPGNHDIKHIKFWKAMKNGCK